MSLTNINKKIISIGWAKNASLKEEATSSIVEIFSIE